MRPFVIRFGAILCGLCVAVSFAQVRQEAKPGVVAIKAGRLIDVEAGTAVENRTIIVEGERIKTVGTAGDL